MNECRGTVSEAFVRYEHLHRRSWQRDAVLVDHIPYSNIVDDIFPEILCRSESMIRFFQLSNAIQHFRKQSISLLPFIDV